MINANEPNSYLNINLKISIFSSNQEETKINRKLNIHIHLFNEILFSSE